MRNAAGWKRGFSLIEIMIAIAVVLILAAIAVPSALDHLKNAREVAAIQAIRTIHTAQLQHYSQFSRFAGRLDELASPARLIPPDMAGGTKGGYRFTVEIRSDGYAIRAAPLVFPSNGRRTFYSDETQVIRQNWGAEAATGDSPPIN